MKNILFIVSIIGHGKGGHIHSLDHTSRQIAVGHNVRILTLGPGCTKTIARNPHFFKHIPFDGKNIFRLRKELKSTIHDFQPDIYHCFDIPSYNVIRVLVDSRNSFIVLTKCGGPNPDPIEFPLVKNLVLFSRENMDWFQGREQYLHSNIALIPNRVHTVNLLDDGELKKDPDKFTFVRIGRINTVYKKTIIDAINLIDFLQSQPGIKKVQLIVIGTIEEQAVFADIQSICSGKSDYVHIMTEDRYTTNASKMLYLADAVVGTGRGLMEASSLGLPVLAIDSENNYPVLLHNANFEEAFRTNFSGRNVFSEKDVTVNLNKIVKLIQDNNYYDELSKFIRQVFDTYFSIEKVAAKYDEFYSRLDYSERYLVKDVRSIFISFFRYYRNAHKVDLLIQAYRGVKSIIRKK